MDVTRPLTLFTGLVGPLGRGAGPTAPHNGPALPREASCRSSRWTASVLALYGRSNGAPRYSAVWVSRRARYVRGSMGRPTGGSAGSPMPIRLAVARRTASGSAVAVVGAIVPLLEAVAGATAPTASVTAARTS